MTAQTKDTLKSYFENDDTPTQSQFGDLIDTFIAHLVFAITQTGVADPTITVLEDTLVIEDPNFIRFANGYYSWTAPAGSFPLGRTFLRMQPRLAATHTLDLRIDTERTLVVETRNNGTYADGLLNQTLVEIQIYPAE